MRMIHALFFMFFILAHQAARGMVDPAGMGGAWGAGMSWGKPPTKFYELLDVYPSASQQEIRAAYQKLAQQIHPDKQAPENQEKAEAAFRILKTVYETLKDPQSRARYDRGEMIGLELQIEQWRTANGPQAAAAEGRSFSKVCRDAFKFAQYAPGALSKLLKKMVPGD